MASPAVQTSQEELIATVDLHELRQLRWPFIRLFFPRFVEELELARFVKGLLATRRWLAIRVVPHRDGPRLSEHVFDVYGSRAGAQAEGGVHLEPGSG
jgi:hypothetical protein